MKNLFRVSAIAVVCALMMACAANRPAGRDYSAYKESMPRSILVLPPVNQSPDVNASLSMLSVTTEPLAEAGYYVMPVALVNETFKQNGVTTADDAQQIPAGKLRDIFGADSALYITVSKYGTSYRVISSVVEVEASAKLVDLRTGAVLWSGSAKASSDENKNYNNGGLIGALIGAAIDQVVHNVADDSHTTADVTSIRLLSAGRPNGLLYGPYNPKYQTD
ncbi:DUF799 domain-containing protein [Dyella mobilis]|uniref:DUF799 domain-containing protein n=1 Tax=Dyella mobilis TaxID=1849582 RepID=A0ABS2KDV2_9GAMM|nr:DUF799 domain-containing protein [Dyella mobilis]MBM7129351.1 DUF799 domain-containing protein [Dyella mobilis]GLQ98645.1 lipoprotein [Dyella mobilis]